MAILYGTNGADSLSGTIYNDSIYAFDGNDYLYGNAGNDYLYGYGGNDYINGGTGNDVYVVDNAYDGVYEYAGGGIDTVYSYVSHSLSSNVENLYLYGSAYYGYGNSLNNIISGNSYSNYLWGGDGNDSIYDYAGDDTLSGGNGNDYLSSGAGNDTLIGGLGNDTLVGGDGNDRLNGYGTYRTDDSQFDKLSGGAGTDYFVLGGAWGVSYVESGDGYAVIQGWNGAQDYVEVKGSLSQYSLEYKSVSGIGSSAQDTEIYFTNASGQRDRIAIIEDSTNIARSSYYFKVV
jgi:serralysin